MVIFHGYVTNNQMVYETCSVPHRSLISRHGNIMKKRILARNILKIGHVEQFLSMYTYILQHPCLWHLPFFIFQATHHSCTSAGLRPCIKLDPEGNTNWITQWLVYLKPLILHGQIPMFNCWLIHLEGGNHNIRSYIVIHILKNLQIPMII